MFKMIKYEFRKNISALFIMLFLIALIQGYFITSTLLKKEHHSAISLSIFAFACLLCYGFVLLYGILSYSRDLKSKEGYLLFMAPISTYKIIGAKFITTFLTGVVLVAILFVFGSIDLTLMDKMYHLGFIKEFIDGFLSALGKGELKDIIIKLAIWIIVLLIQFFTYTVIGYLSISLSCTLLQNKKGKGLLSFILFIALCIVITIFSNKFTPTHDIKNNLDYFVSYLPLMLYELAIILVGFIGSGALLDKKISL